jgi:muconate cycloisomerase
MKITGIETIPVSIPIDAKRAVRGGGGAHLISEFVIVKVLTDEGITGLGEVSCTPIWSGEDYRNAIRVIDTYIAPALIGEDPRAIEAIGLKLKKSIANNPFTKAGVEIACWDILGKVTGLPVYRLLGGPVRDFVTTKFSVTGMPAPIAAEVASGAVEQGFRAMKVKVGVDPESDVARVRAVREAIGPDIYLGVDANGGWSPGQAATTIPRLIEFDLKFVEQPVPALDMAWMADVRARTPLPIIADESLYTIQDAMALARGGAADVFSIYIGKGGGLNNARKVAAIAESAGLTCTIGSNLEMGIAMAAMIHLGMAMPSIDSPKFPCDILSNFYYESDYLAEPLLITAGTARPFEKPGLGVELDPDKIRHYRID